MRIVTQVRYPVAWVRSFTLQCGPVASIFSTTPSIFATELQSLHRGVHGSQPHRYFFAKNSGEPLALLALSSSDRLFGTASLGVSTRMLNVTKSLCPEGSTCEPTDLSSFFMLYLMVLVVLGGVFVWIAGRSSTTRLPASTRSVRFTEELPSAPIREPFGTKPPVCSAQARWAAASPPQSSVHGIGMDSEGLDDMLRENRGILNTAMDINRSPRTSTWPHAKPGSHQRLERRRVRLMTMQ